jgi:predicted ABC-type ATPase
VVTSAVEALASEGIGEIGLVERNRIRDLYLASAYPVVDRRPQLFAAAGNIAAGKTSLLRFLSSAGKLPAAHAVRHDPDAVMSEISGYRADTLVNPANAFERWEIPARKLADEIFTAAVERRCDVVYDRTCAFPETVQLFRNVKMNEHYHLNMYFVWAFLPECLQRAKQRAQSSRRFVPEKVIVERAEALRALFPKYLEIVDEMSIYENHDGKGPRLIATFQQGSGMQAVDAAALEAFRAEYKI